ncbi:MAG: threonylcarbamoyl-AMP synthase [Armatimonadetes bacterium]|nr:threonylcarbamoyl-AMP synthase [Armatimonadota bacterium]
MRIEKATTESIKEAARVLREGGLVVIPTETVYGLACDALNVEAVRKVYEVKGRPTENPLIVHIADFDSLGDVAESWPDACERLAERFWPGPLTLVLPRKATVPKETTGGLDTIAVRVPQHPVALDFIREVGGPIAAPSANPFMGLSPTSADAIDPQIGEGAEMVLDGGRCDVGLESTVVDLSGDHPRVLRPGGVTRAQVQAVVGGPLGHHPPPNVKASPGMYPRHYAPQAKLILVTAVADGQVGLKLQGEPCSGQIRMPLDPRAYAANLYAALRSLDQDGVREIAVEMPPESPDWEAVLDRLKKAASD